MGTQAIAIGYLNQNSVLVASGQKLSTVISTAGMSLCGVLLPTGLTSTALTFNACDAAGGSFVPVKSTTSGSALSYTVAGGEYVAIDPSAFAGILFLQLQFGTNEGADRNITVSLKGI